VNPELVISRLTASAAVAGAVALATTGATEAGARSGAAPVRDARSVQVRTFTAPHAGWIRTVDLVLDGDRGRPARVTVVIRALGPGGAPTRTVLAGASVPAGAGRMHVQLPTPPAVRSGASYSIAISAPLGTMRVWDAVPVLGMGSAPPAFRCTAS
jgi:hypothetical protein